MRNKASKHRWAKIEGDAVKLSGLLAAPPSLAPWPRLLKLQRGV